jgi:hypothetical protein
MIPDALLEMHESAKESGQHSEIVFVAGNVHYLLFSKRERQFSFSTVLPTTRRVHVT